MSKKTTVTEYFDENGNITSRITETEDVYTSYKPYTWDPPSGIYVGDFPPYRDGGTIYSDRTITPLKS